MSRSRKVPVTQRLQSSGLRLARTARNIVVLAAISRLFAQSPPVSSARPWHSSEEQETMREAQRFHPPTVRIEPETIYSLAELIDLAEHTTRKHASRGNTRAPKRLPSESLAASYFQRCLPLP